MGTYLGTRHHSAPAFAPTGGRCQAGETDETTAIREVEEEVGFARGLPNHQTGTTPTWWVVAGTWWGPGRGACLPLWG